jgi:hypothetical protein
MAGGTLLAAREAGSRGGVAINLGGGLHHARAAAAAGFCLINDIAVAIAALRAEGVGSRMLVIDLDVHDGDGTRSIFSRDPSVHTFSIHDRSWDDAPAEESTSVALGPGTGDGELLTALRERLPALLAGFRPDFVFYVAGTDAAYDDRRGEWRMTAEGLLARDRFVFESCRSPKRPLPLVITLGGGYGNSSWRYSARFLAWILSGGSVIEPPSTEDLVLSGYRRVAGSFSEAELIGPGGPVDWTLEPADVHQALAAHVSASRWLGYYSIHAIELALERYGFLDQLRERGFDEPSLSFLMTDESRQTLRIHGSPDSTELLVELTVHRDRTSVPGLELLSVDWLLLQNPRERFTRSRPALEGQQHPGLGLLREAAALLVLSCERIGLDGLLFAPSHYHLAVQSLRHLKFLHPEEQAKFLALFEPLAGLPLREAAEAVAGGQIEDAVTGERFEWAPAPMVLPVSERLRAMVESEEYERRVQKELAQRRFRLRGAD